MTNRIALLTLAVAAMWPAAAGAQGKSNQPHGNGAPPSSSALPIAPPGVGALPLAWVDDANLLAPGAMSVDISMTRWAGDGVAEFDAPIVNAAFGLTSRVQLAASVPHVIGSDATGVAGGLGTSYFSAKIAAYENRRAGVKLAAAPTLELLGSGVLPSLGPNETRAQIGLPVSVEVDRGPRRFYAASGWFSRGVWFAGGGAGFQATRRTGASASFSRSWTTADPLTGATRDRMELSGGLAYALTGSMSAFASLTQSIATLPQNGAGTTLAGGVSFSVRPARTTPRRR
jgi:hypothetical protein